ncbi:MAG: hypothetical protein JW910_05005, partial [Anaerolineae bacterium]|nr:hypothetical protein [Anaerolineae bacterium]
MGFEDLGDLSELDEMPPFDEDLDIPELDEPGGGGVSRTFKIIGAIILLTVVVIVIALVAFALQGGDDLSPGEQTSQARIAMNQTTENDYFNTLTALA